MALQRNVLCYFTSRMPERVRKLLDELKAWCDLERGRRWEVARFVGVQRQVVSNWFAHRQEPTGEQVLALLEFLRKQRRRR
jgi:DNA-binding transcriptional regulator YiaG